MKSHQVTIDISEPGSFPKGRFDADRVDATTEADIARHISEDEAEAAQHAARYTRMVRKCVFRGDAPTDSELMRPPIPILSAHGFRGIRPPL